MLNNIKSIIKRQAPKPILDLLLKCRDVFRSKISGIPMAPFGTDWVGYETLTKFIKSNDILSVEGNLAEIGTFLGGGAYKLSKFLEKRKSSKKLFVIDIFDPNFEGITVYLNELKTYKGKSQWEVFLEVTKDCNNIVVLKGDSKNIEIPSNKLCFAFIDGNHDPEYVENDFYLTWNKLSSKGAVAFHDYKWNLPQTTEKIKELVNRHASEIQETRDDKNKHIFFVVKK